MEEDTRQQCAVLVIDTVNLIMRIIGTEMNKRSRVLSMPQLRAMMIIEQNKHVSLSRVAEELGTTLSTASKLIDSLVGRGFILRETVESDRRKLHLALTDPGQQALASVHLEALSCLKEKLAVLTSGECAMIKLAVDMLRGALMPVYAPTA